MIFGGGQNVGAPLVSHPDVSIVSFTGSTATGKTINEMAASNFKRVSLEMGGKNAIIVMDDADLDLAVDGALWGGFGTSGQRCTAASRLILHERSTICFWIAFYGVQESEGREWIWIRKRKWDR